MRVCVDAEQGEGIITQRNHHTLVATTLVIWGPSRYCTISQRSVRTIYYENEPFHTCVCDWARVSFLCVCDFVGVRVCVCVFLRQAKATARQFRE
jgi:hypothetical protein